MADRVGRRAARGARVSAVIGWREWVSLPELGIRALRAKVDTGARSSSLHALDVESFRRGGKRMVRFKVQPGEKGTRRTVTAEAELRGERRVRTSSGAQETRLWIRTVLQIQGRRWKIDLTLSRRDEMGFRMLVGRSAIGRRFLVDPGRSYLQGPGVASRRPADPATRGG